LEIGRVGERERSRELEKGGNFEIEIERIGEGKNF
jgi:hypothetical protein